MESLPDDMINEIYKFLEDISDKYSFSTINRDNYRLLKSKLREEIEKNKMIDNLTIKHSFINFYEIDKLLKNVPVLELKNNSIFYENKCIIENLKLRDFITKKIEILTYFSNYYRSNVWMIKNEDVLNVFRINRFGNLDFHREINVKAESKILTDYFILFVNQKNVSIFELQNLDSVFDRRKKILKNILIWAVTGPIKFRFILYVKNDIKMMLGYYNYGKNTARKNNQISDKYSIFENGKLISDDRLEKLSDMMDQDNS